MLNNYDSQVNVKLVMKDFLEPFQLVLVVINVVLVKQLQLKVLLSVTNGKKTHLFNSIYRFRLFLNFLFQ